MNLNQRVFVSRRDRVSLTPDFNPVKIRRPTHEPFQRLPTLKKAVETARRSLRGLNTGLKPGVNEKFHRRLVAQT
jgi:hypothetical protein